ATLLRSPSDEVLSPTSRRAPVNHGLKAGKNVVVIEVGQWRTRCGLIEMWDSRMDDGVRQGTMGKSYFDDFPTCVARPRQEGMDLHDLVSGASSLAAPMFRKFRE
ncbi:unnamed protein product, partial [Discosporangium mesarthrocarpum]